jgi:hypothetical protein
MNKRQLSKTVLIFPDMGAMSDFVIREHLTNVEINSIDKTLLSYLTEGQIVLAEFNYEAILFKRSRK